MIKNNFTDYMDFRKGFFSLIKNIVFFSTEGVFNAEEAHFQIFIDSIIWALKHDQPELADLGLDAMTELINKVASVESISNDFFQHYFIKILEDIFFVLTDSLHQGGFQK